MINIGNARFWLAHLDRILAKTEHLKDSPRIRIYLGSKQSYKRIIISLQMIQSGSCQSTEREILKKEARAESIMAQEAGNKERQM